MAMSTMPFAIGQVQDAGLIFLSHMATRIAESLPEPDGATDEVIQQREKVLRKEHRNGASIAHIHEAHKPTDLTLPKARAIFCANAQPGKSRR
jgi:hypothetical protein